MYKSVISIENLEKTINGKKIVKNINLEIFEGEVFGFIGPNGAGKSTTLKIIVGLMKKTKGNIMICGKNIENQYKEAISEIGAVIENPELYTFFNGWQNLKYFSRMSNSITNEKINETIKLVGLDNAINTKVSKYSLGMKQRLGIAQALLHSPSILILDEPTNGLDPVGKIEFRRYIKKLSKESKVTIIISSHQLSEIELLCDRIGVIKNGEIVAVKDLKKIINDQQNFVSIDAYPRDKTIKILNDLNIEISSINEEIKVVLKRKDVPFLITKLVEKNISIYNIRLIKANLEQQFFEFIGENQIE